MAEKISATINSARKTVKKTAAEITSEPGLSSDTSVAREALV